jgi:hypothetical protein
MAQNFDSTTGLDRGAPPFTSFVNPHCFDTGANSSTNINENTINHDNQILTFSSQALGLTGPFSLGFTYSKLGGYILQGQMNQAINSDNAYSLAFELGTKERRISATFGNTITEQQRIKLSVEYLMQDLSFNFVTGTVDQWIGQVAYGLAYEYVIPEGIINDFNLNLTYSKAENKNIADVRYFDQSNRYFEDIQRVAGGEDIGASAGIDLLPTTSTKVGLKLNYDAVHYDTRYVANQDTSGLGATVEFEQLLSNKLKLHLLASERKPYDEYRAELNWLLHSKPGTSLEMGLSGEYIVGGATLANDTRVGVNLKYAFANDPLAPQDSYKFEGKRQSSGDLVNWTGVPAVHMAQVLAIKDELVRQLMHPIKIVPSSCPIGGCSSIQIDGNGFLAPFNGGLSPAQAAYNANANVNYPITINFGSNSVTGYVVGDTEINTSAPPHALGPVDVTVFSPDGQNFTIPGGLTYVNSIIETITPSSGFLSGGRKIIITGQGFPVGQPITVSFDDVASPSASILSINQVAALTPAHAKGEVNVVVKTSAGPTAALKFDYKEASIEPTIGPLGGGTAVTITGAGFTDADHTSVQFGDADAKNITIKSETELTAITPPAPGGLPGNVNVVISNKNTDATPADSFTIHNGFNYLGLPIVTAVTPTSGTTLGGTEIIIDGGNIAAGATVTIGGKPATVTFIDTEHQHIHCITPTHDSGDVDITITNPDHQSGTKTNIYTYTDDLLIRNIQPTSGSSNGGTAVTIKGENFKTDTATYPLTIKFGETDVTGTIAVIDAKTITCSTPTHTVGTVDVKVTQNAKTSTLPQAYTYTQAPAPTITSFAPTSGTTAGGTEVIISGENFAPGATVAFDNTPATAVSVDTEHKHIHCNAPAHTVGDVDIKVTNPDAQQATAPTKFTYTASLILRKINPNLGPSTGGQLVTIYGENLVAGAANVTFDNISATDIIVDVASQIITCKTPAHATGPVNVQVTQTSGSDTLSNGYYYNLGPVPIITAIDPASGTIAGGTVAIISGQNLVSATKVYFDNQEATNINVDVEHQHIHCNTPNHAAGPVTVKVTNPDTQSGEYNSYNYTEDPIARSISPISGSSNGGTTVTIKGENFKTDTATYPVTAKFGETDVTSAITVVDANTITCSTPGHIAGTVDVKVTQNTKTSILPQAYTYTQAPAPTITSFTPTAGTTVGGTEVIISGENFAPGATVTFDNTPATAVSVDTEHKHIHCNTPAHAAGDIDIKVINPDTQQATAPTKFTYHDIPIPRIISPDHGTTNGGTVVTITGENFAAGAAVKFGDSDATGVSVDVPNQTITCTTPAHITDEAVDVKVANTGTTYGILQKGYTYHAPSAAPTISNFSPTSGPIEGGTAVTIKGENFWQSSQGLHPTQVTFAGQQATDVSVVDHQTITCKTPVFDAALAGTLAAVKVINPDDQSVTAATTFTINIKLLSIDPSSTTEHLFTKFTITGNGIQPGAHVFMDGTGMGRMEGSFTAQPINNTITTWFYPDQLTADIHATITVSNPNGSSGTILLPIQNDQNEPLIAGIAPASAPSGSIAYNIDVSGQDINPESLVLRKGDSSIPFVIDEIHSEISSLTCHIDLTNAEKGSWLVVLHQNERDAVLFDQPFTVY